MTWRFKARRLAPIAFSLLLHAPVFYWATMASPAAPSANSPVAVAVVYDDRPAGTFDRPPRRNRSARPASRARSAANRDRTPDLSRLVPAGLLARHAAVVADDPERPDWDEAAAYSVTVAFGDQGQRPAADLSFFSRLWRAIEHELPKEPLLSEYDHVGTAYLRVRFDASGRFDGGGVRARAIDPVLKVLAARATRAAARRDGLNPPRREVFANLRFTWSSYDACATARGVRDEFLSFCRHAERKRRRFTSAERARVVAEAIARAGPWAYEDIKEYNRQHSRRKTEFDPFEALRRDPDWSL